MRFYSDVTHKLYETEEELHTAEDKVNIKKVEQKEAKAKLDEAKRVVEEARKALDDATAAFNKISNDYRKKYLTITVEDFPITGTTSTINSELMDILDSILKK